MDNEVIWFDSIAPSSHLGHRHISGSSIFGSTNLLDLGKGRSGFGSDFDHLSLELKLFGEFTTSGKGHDSRNERHITRAVRWSFLFSFESLGDGLGRGARGGLGRRTGSSGGSGRSFVWRRRSLDSSNFRNYHIERIYPVKKEKNLVFETSIDFDYGSIITLRNREGIAAVKFAFLSILKSNIFPFFTIQRIKESARERKRRREDWKRYPQNYRSVHYARQTNACIQTRGVRKFMVTLDHHWVTLSLPLSLSHSFSFSFSSFDSLDQKVPRERTGQHSFSWILRIQKKDKLDLKLK